MDARSDHSSPTTPDDSAVSPILVVPYTWIGDFVRCHSVVKVLKARWPRRPVDVLMAPATAPLVDYMPGVRKGILADLPHKALVPMRQWRLARQLRAEGYGTALIMPRKWKAALAPFLAGIPERTGYAGEARFGLVNDLRWGERNIPRMVDQCAALALPADAARPAEWPLPELVVATDEVAAWRRRRGLDDDRPIIALAPGSVARSRRWPAEHYGALARSLAEQGLAVWIVGGPDEKSVAAVISAASGDHARDLTGGDLRNGILALAAASIVISNDSGLLHVAAALGVPTIGIFGPTDAWRWGPLNPLAAAVAAETLLPC